MLQKRDGHSGAIEGLLPVLDVPVEPSPRHSPSRRRRSPKKVLNRRHNDQSQAVRSSVQIVFLLLNLLIGLQFLLWVRYFESGGSTWQIGRPPGVEGWLPIASLMNLKAWIMTGVVTQIHPAGMFLLVAFLAISVLIKKSFCSWLCPIGTISEALWKGGEKLFGRNFRLPKWFDIPLRSLKYLLLGLFVYAVGSMPVEGIKAFLEGPYGVVADVKMLNFFRYLSLTGVIVISFLMLLSVLVKNFWCRYLCPYGALMGLVGMLSPNKIRRDTELCVDCGKCAKACPSNLPVDQLVVVNSAECFACMQCVASCPSAQALELRGPGRFQLRPWMAAAAISIVFLGVVAGARLTGHWHTQLPDDVYFDLVPRAEQFSHP
ncbi:MAG: 4Fe-4S binding protein [Acidobacteriota bacterium]|nr:MAG: 4Fe-4S binding protein [Acidobacteriota bacterium]